VLDVDVARADGGARDADYSVGSLEQLGLGALRKLKHAFFPVHNRFHNAILFYIKTTGHKMFALTPLPCAFTDIFKTFHIAYVLL
jgi:hypothetical protein